MTDASTVVARAQATLTAYLADAQIPWEAGFLTSMRKEWAWRVARGESLANLEAFRSVLQGSENNPDYAVGPPRERDASDSEHPSGG
jgi:hypothetical protein